MEVITGLLLLFFGWAIVQWILQASARTVSAVTRTVTGKGSLTDNLKAAFGGLDFLEVRLADQHIGDNNDVLVKEIQGKGVLPVFRTVRAAFVTSVFDKTSGNFEPVISVIEAFQEPGNVAFQHVVEIGEVSPGSGTPSWVRLGVIIPDMLQPPNGGRRDLVAVIRMIDLDNPPGIALGYHDEDHDGLLWQSTLNFSHTFEEKGYKEVAEHRDEAMALALKVGVAVAMADGSLDDREGEKLKEWIIKAIGPYSEEKKEELKSTYNDALREGYAEARSGNLSLSSLTQRLNEIGEKASKYQAVELCFDIMASDGVADAEEMKVIRRVSEALGLDKDEIENMRDQRIVSLDTLATNQASIEDLLGIESDWDEGRIKGHLRSEFQKWNNRLNTLPEGEERENAQRMLDLLAEARKKYD